MATEIWVNIGSVNGLLPDGNKPLPEPMLTYRQYDPVAFIWGQFHQRSLKNKSLKLVLKITYPKFRSNLPGANELRIYVITGTSQEGRGVLNHWQRD